MTGIIREVTIGPCRLIQGDCLEVLPLIGRVDAVVTDPPYGIGYNPTRSQNSAASGHRKQMDNVIGDDTEFDPSVILQLADKIVSWGANYYANKMPNSGGWLVWDKRDGGSLFRGFQMSDCEIAWCSNGKMVRAISHRWCGHLRDSEKNLFVHPTQKPVAVMEWCIQEVGSHEGDMVIDPFMGSGTTGVACIKTGRNFIGIEKEPKYFDSAVSRIRRAWQDKCSEIKFDEPAEQKQLTLV